MTLVAGIFFVGLRRLLATIANARAELSDQEMGGGARDDRRHALRYRHGLARRHGARAGDDARSCSPPFSSIVRRSPCAISRWRSSSSSPSSRRRFLGASFQLSFAAVAALIAVYEWRGALAQSARSRPIGGPEPLRRMARERCSIGCCTAPARRWSQRSAQRRRPPPSWPSISTSSAPMC